MTDTVQNNIDKNRYELTVDGHLAATYYRIADGVITFVHTEVPDELAGRGVGARLVKGALDQGARRRTEGGAAMPVRQGLHRKASGLCRSAETVSPPRPPTRITPLRIIDVRA